MLCPKCQFENREGAIFCGKCGAGISLVCPKCNTENPPENMFCDKCGHHSILPSEPTPKGLSFDEKLDKVEAVAIGKSQFHRRGRIAIIFLS